MKQDEQAFFKALLEQHPDDFFEQMEEFQRMMMMFRSAIREVTTKLRILNDELSLKHNQNPIKSIESRVKQPMSIAQKLADKGKTLSVESVVDCLNDVAGIRVICSFIDDIYRVADMLAAQDDVTLLAVKDYIKTPKENGYRSYHMLLEIPVFFSDRKQSIKVEVQIRTVAMDFWASLEHQLKYKAEGKNSGAISAELKKCADVVSATDLHMMEIRNMMEAE